nr:MAG TPA: hypothetical protein [Caudoviricetes sp.]
MRDSGFPTSPLYVPDICFGNIPKSPFPCLPVPLLTRRNPPNPRHN